ncbi:hypothetical protein [Microbispora sp. H10949]|uniref:hypothetical protein n=1 Tax=Microbispora sp. H10949 TaxID=2729111 RepID=UPI0016049D7D|nr:hypothetical protein [Microbispora sp. H10949]
MAPNVGRLPEDPEERRRFLAQAKRALAHPETQRRIREGNERAAARAAGAPVELGRPLKEVIAELSETKG